MEWHLTTWCMEWHWMMLNGVALGLYCMEWYWISVVWGGTGSLLYAVVLDLYCMGWYRILTVWSGTGSLLYGVVPDPYCMEWYWIPTVWGGTGSIHYGGGILDPYCIEWYWIPTVWSGTGSLLYGVVLDSYCMGCTGCPPYGLVLEIPNLITWPRTPELQKQQTLPLTEINVMHTNIVAYCQFYSCAHEYRKCPHCILYFHVQA